LRKKNTRPNSAALRLCVKKATRYVKRFCVKKNTRPNSAGLREKSNALWEPILRK